MAERVAGPAYDEPPRETAGKESPLLEQFKRRLKAAERARKPFERDWKIAAAFLANKQWIGYDEDNGRVVQLRNPQKRVRYTVNMLTGYYKRFQGKLLADDTRPDVTFRREDMESRNIAEEARRALEYAWEEEAHADVAYALASAKRLTYGLGFIRVRPDQSLGQELGEFPVGPDGEPVVEPNAMHKLVEKAFATGEKLEWRMLREAKLKFEAGGPFELYPPPGVEHEQDFPWLIIGRPVALNQVKGLYAKATDMQPEAIKLVDSVGLVSDTGQAASHAKLEDHVMLYTGYEFPCPEYPLGREVVWARDTELDSDEKLQYVVKGEAKAGVVFFKFTELAGRFWPMGMIEAAVGAQRQINWSRSQNQEIKDRVGLPRIYATENTVTEVNRPKGFIGEVINMRPGAELPKEMGGVGPGAWIQNEAELCKADMDNVMTMRADAAAAPPGVTAYSAYAHFNEQEDQAIGPIRSADRESLKELAWYALHTIRLYWPPEKHIAVAGEDELMDTVLFQRAFLPEEFYVKIGKGAPGPQSQAARIQLIMDVYDRAMSSGQVLPLHWLTDSLEAGQPLPLPTNEMQAQEELAQFENVMIAQGQQIVPQHYHNQQLHAKMHRAAQTAYANVPGYELVVQALEMHIQQHLELASMMAAQVPPGQAATGGGPTNPGGFGAVGAAPVG